MADSSWSEVRAAAAAVVDVETEVRRKGGWTAEEAAYEAQRLQAACNLPDTTTAFRSVLDILLMRERFEISESLTHDAQYQLVEIMWLRNWTGDEIRAGLTDVLTRFQLQPPKLQHAVQALLEIGHGYRGMAQPDRWPNREARAACAELMWLGGLSENDAYHAARAAMRRFELARGKECDALRALQEIELMYRRTAFDPAFEESDRRRFAEIMWLRGWTLHQGLEQALAVRTSLGIAELSKVIDALHQISLRCGGPAVPNPVTRAVDAILGRGNASAEERELLRTQFGEYRWLQRSNVAQAMEKIRRYASMTETPLRDVFDAALDAARRAYQERETAKD